MHTTSDAVTTTFRRQRAVNRTSTYALLCLVVAYKSKYCHSTGFIINTILTVLTFCTGKYCPRGLSRPSVRGECNDGQFSLYRTDETVSIVFID